MFLIRKITPVIIGNINQINWLEIFENDESTEKALLT